MMILHSEMQDVKNEAEGGCRMRPPGRPASDDVRSTPLMAEPRRGRQGQQREGAAGRGKARCTPVSDRTNCVSIHWQRRSPSE